MNDHPAPPRPDNDRRDDAATATPATPDAATAPRHLYTLTVEKVGVILNHHGVDRDVRTIQRWCKSGKVRAIFDPVNADRYLIEPSSVDDMVATLLEEKQRQAAYEATVSRHAADTVATSSASVAARDNRSKNDQGDSRAHVATTADDVAAASDARRDDAATDELNRLRAENATLRADVQVRQQMVEYMTGQFEKTMEIALDRSQELGTMQERVRVLETDNARLQGMLPEAREVTHQTAISFHPRSIRLDAEGDNPTRPPAPDGV